MTILDAIVSRIQQNESEASFLFNINDISIQLLDGLTEFISIIAKSLENLPSKRTRKVFSPLLTPNPADIQEIILPIIIDYTILGKINQFSIRSQILQSFRADLFLSNFSIIGQHKLQILTYKIAFPTQMIKFSTKIKSKGIPTEVAFDLPSFNASYLARSTSDTSIDQTANDLQASWNVEINDFNQVVSSSMFNHILVIQQKFLTVIINCVNLNLVLNQGRAPNIYASRIEMCKTAIISNMKNYQRDLRPLNFKISRIAVYFAHFYPFTKK